MATSMGPPMLPGFSLRVQLFSPHAHALNDKPLRCFRVVTSPDATVREFCEEASRIHEINYGEPIAIKKCQDDQEFDITQNEILGTLFANTATIRLIQAPATPGDRDSVPPTSALRFDPTNHLGRKRERDGSARPNGSASSSTWRPNKRQRVSDLDPDQPLPSRERDLDIGGAIDEEEERRDEMIPDSQQGSAYKENHGNSRHVRDDSPRISETPSPPPELPDFARFGYGSADRQGQKSNIPNTDDPIMSQTSIPSPFGPASIPEQNSARSKSASYHIQRATERGTSVSTAATSPLSGDQQAPTLNRTRHSTKRKTSDLVVEAPRINGKPHSRSPNEDSIYENVPSDNEGSAILRRTKEKLKGKNSPSSGLRSLDWAKKFNTPPNGSRRTSGSQERTASNGELPLTPNSKEREERQRQNEEADAARKVRVAAAEAARQRKREADEARAAEDRERMRKLREQSERDAQQKRNEVIAKATRLEKERLEKMRKVDEEREAEGNRREQERIRDERERNEPLKRDEQAMAAKERQEVARLEMENQTRIEGEQQEQERLKREKAKAAEAERAIKEEAERRAKETALAMEEMRKSRDQSEQSKASTPDRSKAPIRPQSSTPFIPCGRKSALKAPSSQAANSSSPVLARTVSAGSSNGSKPDIEPPNAAKRRVSFDLKEPLKQTPIRTPILPPSRSSTSKPASKPVPPNTPTSKPPTVATKEPSAKLSMNGSALPAKKSTTPIPLPSTKQSSIPPITKSILPATQSTSQKRDASNGSTTSKESAKSASPPPVLVTISSDESEEEEDEDDDDDEEDLDGPTRIDPVKALNTSLRPPAKSKLHSEPASPDEEEDEEDEENDEGEDGGVKMQDIQSNRSSSRSPIMFNSHATPRKSEPAKPSISASSTSDEWNDEDDSDEEESTDGEAETSEGNEEPEDKTITAQISRSSPPSLPTKKPIANVLPTEKSSQPSSTAVKSTPIPPPSSSAATPKFSFGASLSSLNARKPVLGSSVAKASGKAQPLKLVENDEESEEESEEESDDSSSESDNGQEASQSLPRTRQIQPLTTDSDDSDSDSESSSDKENQDEREMARNELVAHIAKMASDPQASTQSNDIPSSNIAKRSQSSNSGGGGKRSNGGSGKNYITGYSFSQPK